MIVVAQDWLRRALRTFVDAFLVTFGVLIIPKLGDLVESITNSAGTGSIDLDIDVYGKLALAAVLAGLIAVFNGFKNRTEDVTGKDLIVSKTG